MSKEAKIPGINWFLKKFEREEVLKKFPGRGAIFFIVGCLLVVKLFDRDIALASIMILTFGDSVSHLFGLYFGKIKHPLNGLKKLEGNIFGSIAGGFMAMFFVNYIWAFSGALIAMVIEAIEVKMGNNVIDDNILIPLIAGTIMYIFKTGFLFF
jgi:dolichol kinase